MAQRFLSSTLILFALSLAIAPPAYPQTAPVISNVKVSKIRPKSVTITWRTSRRTRCRIEYGQTTSYGKRTRYSRRLTARHRASLRRLKGHTDYHYRILARDRRGLTASSEDFTFTTAEHSVPRPIVTRPSTRTRRKSAKSDSGLTQIEIPAAHSPRPTIDEPVVSPALSISISPNLWNLGEVEAGTTTTMRELDKVTVTNDGGTREDFTLSLVSPEGWVAGSRPGAERFVLNAAFSNNPDNIVWDERTHLVTTEPAVSTRDRFAGDQNGAGVLPGERRNLYLQFKSPIRTKLTDLESIRLIISCEASKNLWRGGERR